MHYRARTHDPRLGRFLQPDPLEESRIDEHYTYASLRPSTLVDPLGLRAGGTGDTCTSGADDPPSVSKSCTVELWCTNLHPLLSLLLFLAPKHCELQITDCWDRVFQLGGEKDRKGSGKLDTWAKPGPFPAESAWGTDWVYWDAKWEYPCDGTAAGGEVMCDCLMGVASALDMQVEYELIFTNSNSVVAAMFEWCGINDGVSKMPWMAIGANRNKAWSLLSRANRGNYPQQPSSARVSFGK